MLLHDGQVQGIASRNSSVRQHYFFRAFGCGYVDWQYLIDDPEQSVECGLDRVTPVNCHIPMEDFLEHFRIGHKPFALPDALFNQPLCIGFVRVRRAH